MAKTIAVSDSSGALYDVPSENLQKALASGYKVATGEQLRGEMLQEEYGGTGDEILTGLAGAGAGATFGLLPQALTKTGLVEPETLRYMKEANPVAWATGEIGGVVGSAFIPVPNMVKGADLFRRGITGALLTAEKFSNAGKAVKVMEKAGAYAAGSAAEGALYGAGTLLTDQALGDPDLNAEKVISTLGWSTVLGGGLGTIFGPIDDLLRAKSSRLSSKFQDKAVTVEDVTEAALTDTRLTPIKQKESLVQNLKKLKEDAPEIKLASQKLSEATGMEIKTLPGQISASEELHRWQSLLLQTQSSIGMMARQFMNDGFTAVQKVYESAFSSANKMTAVEVGESWGTRILENLRKQEEPARQLFETLKTFTRNIPLEDSYKKSAVKFIEGLDGFKQRTGSPVNKRGKLAIKWINEAQTVDDLKGAITDLREMIPAVASKGDKYAIKNIVEIMKELEDLATEGVAKKVALDSGDQAVKDAIGGLIELRKEARKGWHSYMNDLREFSDMIGAKKVRSLSDFEEFIETEAPEKIVRRLFDRGNIKKIRRLKEKFPEESQYLFDYQKNKIIEKSYNGGELSLLKVTRELDKYQKDFPELYKVIFDDFDREILEAAQTYYNSIYKLPKKLGPSGTPEGLEAQNYLSSITKSISAGAGVGMGAGAFLGFPQAGAVIGGALGAQGQYARDAMLQKVINSAVAGGPKAEVFMNKLATIERIINKGQNLAEKALETSVIQGQKALKQTPGAVILLNTEEKKKEYKKIEKKLKDGNITEVMLEQSENMTKDIYETAPNISQAIQVSMARSQEFLRSKLPQTNPVSPLDSEIDPSNQEIDKFMKYHAAVEKPLIVFDQVMAGTLNSETMEALQVVYPNLLMEMREAVVDKMTEKDPKKIPYRNKVMLSFFLGTDLTAGVTQQGIANNQNSFRNVSFKQDDVNTAQMVSNKKTSQKGLENVTISERSNTETRDVIAAKA